MADPISANTFFATWQDLLQKSSTFWSQAATPPPTSDPTQPLQQLSALWAESWNNIFAQAPSPEVFQKAQKIWSEQLETVAQAFAQVMGTDAFTALQNRCFGQQLLWQEKLAKAAQPHIDMGLRALHVPSREQVDRLFERVIGMEERLDDLDDTLRQILRCLRAQVTPVATEV